VEIISGNNGGEGEIPLFVFSVRGFFLALLQCLDASSPSQPWWKLRVQ